MNSKTNSKIFIISGPSGAGEDSIIEGLPKDINFNRVITTVTRAMRPNESEGDPYYFTTPQDFKKKVDKGEMIEWAIVYGDYRGATKKEIERVQQIDKPILWKVDWQGVIDIKKEIPEVIAIFIAPPSYETLQQRLIKRGKDTLKTIKQRERYTKNWLQHDHIYDYKVVNQDGKLDEAIEEVTQIIKKHLAQG